MAAKETESDKIVRFPALVPGYGLRYALSTASSGSSIIQFSDQPGQPVPSRNTYVEVRQNLQKAINLIYEVLHYWRIDFVPSSESVRGAFEDLSRVIDLLQQAKATAKESGMDKAFIVELDSAIRAASDVRAQTRTLGGKLSGRRRPSIEKLAQMGEQFDHDLNAVRITLEQLLHRL